MIDKHLPIPEEILKNDEAYDILRVWISNKKNVFVISTETWKDSFAWGILLADLVKHIAKSYSGSPGYDYDVIFNRILDGLNAELGFSTDKFEENT